MTASVTDHVTQRQTCKTKTKTDFFGLRAVLSYDQRSQTTSLRHTSFGSLMVLVGWREVNLAHKSPASSVPRGSALGTRQA